MLFLKYQYFLWNIDVFEGPTLSSNNNENIVLPVSESFKFIKKENNFTIINKEQFSNTSTYYILLSIPVLSLLSFIIFYSLPKRKELNNYENVTSFFYLLADHFNPIHFIELRRVARS